MREQVFLPTGEGSNSTQEEGVAPKVLSRPLLPKGLERPKALSRVIVGFRCRCGRALPRYTTCATLPIYQEDGWSGGGRYDGVEVSGDDLAARRKEFEKLPSAEKQRWRKV
jgi:hypothetical protein